MQTSLLVCCEVGTNLTSRNGDEMPAPSEMVPYSGEEPRENNHPLVIEESFASFRFFMLGGSKIYEFLSLCGVLL